MILGIASSGRCVDCNEPLNSSFHADHRLPFSEGGETIIRNGAALCAPCNLKKGNKMPKLRQWQQDALAKAMNWYRSGQDRHFIINAAPGAGKTLAAIVIAQELLANGSISRVVVIAPRTAVVAQWAKQFERVTGEQMAQITGKDSAMGALSPHLVATWSAIKNLEDAFQAVCRNARTLVICDEHHHAAIMAAWGRSADSAFADADYALILTGTPVRSDGMSSIWLEQDRQGTIDHPSDGSYTLTYGRAVNLGYCRPVTFHRHHGEFSVKIDDDETFSVSSQCPAEVPADHPAVRHLQKSLDFYRLAKQARYEPGSKTPLMTSYHASMIEAASAELDALREELPEAGGLVIAPGIDEAEAFAAIIERLEGSPALVVHSRLDGSDRSIQLFRNNGAIRWIVSVGMVAEGVDIPRLRVLVYLPNGTTELMFRQAVGRVVRSMGKADSTRAYVVMPAFRLFEEYARRIEEDMAANRVVIAEGPRLRRCPICRGENGLDARECAHCGHEFPERRIKFRTCEACDHKNPMHLDVCQHCGVSSVPRYDVTVREAIRDGVISRGVDIDETGLAEAEAEASTIRERLKLIGDDQVARIVSQIPKELLPAFRRLFKDEAA